MKLIYESSVHVLGGPVVETSGVHEFLQEHGLSWDTDAPGGAEYLAETAGRLCYMSYAAPRPGGNAAYLGHIKEVGHGSVLEHANWSFLLTGVSRTLTHELVRHRAGWAYSQLSQRYVDESVAEYVVPRDLAAGVRLAEHLLGQHTEWEEGFRANSWLVSKLREDVPKHILIGIEWIAQMESAHTSYVTVLRLLEETQANWAAMLPPDATKTDRKKYARQAARSVLPNATETKIFCTANARALRHFFEMRATRFAEPEIRVAAYKLWQKMRDRAPNLFGDYTPVPLPDGTFELQTPYRKV